MLLSGGCSSVSAGMVSSKSVSSGSLSLLSAADRLLESETKVLALFKLAVADSSLLVPAASFSSAESRSSVQVPTSLVVGKDWDEADYSGLSLLAPAVADGSSLEPASLFSTTQGLNLLIDLSSWPSKFFKQLDMIYKAWAFNSSVSL